MCISRNCIFGARRVALCKRIAPIRLYAYRLSAGSVRALFFGHGKQGLGKSDLHIPLTGAGNGIV